MANGLGVDAVWIAEKPSHEVKIMDRMDRDLDPLQALEESEKIPWRVDGEVDLDVDETPEKLEVERVLDRQHHRRKAKLEIDWSDEPALAADLRIAVASSRSVLIGFWTERGSRLGRAQAPIDARPGGVAEIEDRALVASASRARRRP